MHRPAMHVFGERQSAAVWQGNAHFLYCKLQWCRPHGTSSVQLKAYGPGTAMAMEPLGAGAGPGGSVAAGAVG